MGVEHREELLEAAPHRAVEKRATLFGCHGDALLPEGSPRDEARSAALHGHAELLAESLVVHAGREHRPGRGDRGGHRLARGQRAGVLELEQLRATRLQEDGAVADQIAPASRERCRGFVVQAVRHRLDDAQELLPAAVVERRPDQLRGVAVDVLAVRPDEDHDLGSCCTALTCSGGAEAIDQPRPAQPADGVETIRLDPHQEPHIAGQRTALDDLDHGNVRIEKHRAGVAPYGVDDVVLDRTLRLGVGRQPGRLQHLDQRVAVIGGYDGQPAAGVGDPRQRGDLGRREVLVATLC